ncbi:glycosyltransferase family 2 protein [Polynucleobacter paneuropaeus]|nr:glycosyltransferase family 2 protein [Polynucleobacter paneuropaeus]
MKESSRIEYFDKSKILVSVGIPTFNRPIGLRRTLNQILNQTHFNLEVIISDNASTNAEVAEVCREFLARDSRIKYFKQVKNIGAIENFKYVLNCASGDYFMWAADDDEWFPNFIEKCLNASAEGESVGCKFDTYFRYSGERNVNPIPDLDTGLSAFENVTRFFGCMQPSLIYGLHRRLSLEFYKNLPIFDFSDCYFVLHQILGPGFRTIPEVLYIAGVDAEKYEIKYSSNPSVRRLEYATFFIKTSFLLVQSKKLNSSQKFDALKSFLNLMTGIIQHHEKCQYPRMILLKQIAGLLIPRNKSIIR